MENRRSVVNPCPPSTPTLGVDMVVVAAAGQDHAHGEMAMSLSVR